MSEEKIKRQAEIAWENYQTCLENNTPEHSFKELFRMALKFQDRITRHACSEAVLKIANEEFPNICDVNVASAVCININTL
ncbi:MAG: hypothetical protein GY861_02645 [bacterium]|nr:hypothetical protein [bacterium]